jgi:hypothetical protein
MRANIVKNLANSPLLPSVFALLARILILNLYRLELIEVPLKPRSSWICWVATKPLGKYVQTYKVTSKSVLAWKKFFLANATLTFNVDGAVSGVKAELADKEKKDMVKPEHNAVSIHKQCE